jgi:succinate dehydrogenase/fumarate reductase flavoprotein subunit
MIVRHRADILVIGGGMAGLWAAVRASELSKKVLVVDKGKIGRSGCAAFAAGIYFLPFPSDDRKLWIQEIVENGCFYNDQEWLSLLMDEVYDLSLEMDRRARDYGFAIFERDSQGEFLRRKSRANYHTLHAVINALPMMDTLRKMALDKGVHFIERTMIHDLFMDEGRAKGAVGFNPRTADIHLFRVNAVILAAGGTAFKAAFLGHKNLTGDLQAAAFRSGVIFQNMENILSNTSARDYDVAGLSLYVGCGGRFINGLGEEFMESYHPTLGNRAPLQYLVLAMCREVKEGRGPIFLDMSETTPPDRELLRKILPEAFRIWDRSRYRFFEDKIPWAPALPGTISSGGGARINLHCETNVPGLFATGDVTSVPPHGAYSVGGVNLAFAALSGFRAAERASQFVSQGLGRLPNEMIDQSIDRLTLPLRRNNGIDPNRIIGKVQSIMTSMGTSYLKSESSLTEALNRLLEVKEEMLPRVKAEDPHYLLAALEAENLVTLAEVMIRASLFRKESRGFHFREDFPVTDNKSWLRWVLAQKDGTEVRLWTVPIPTPIVRPSSETMLPPGVRVSPR